MAVETRDVSAGDGFSVFFIFWDTTTNEPICAPYFDSREQAEGFLSALPFDIRKYRYSELKQFKTKYVSREASDSNTRTRNLL